MAYERRECSYAAVVAIFALYPGTLERWVTLARGAVILTCPVSSDQPLLENSAGTGLR